MAPGARSKFGASTFETDISKGNVIVLKKVLVFGALGIVPSLVTPLSADNKKQM